jgi:SecD/SecF fusion protein
VLTVLGYSMYDTIIIFDRIRENITLMKRASFRVLTNVSLWETIPRSLATTFITLVPIVALFLFGGETLKDFAFAMLIGVITGAYSSIFVAVPILVILKEREPKYRQHRARLEGRADRRPRPVQLVPPAEPGVDEAVEEHAAVGATSDARAAARTGPQRPRPKSRRRPPAKRKRR